ncbi:MAG: zinc ribbon domain-containing protein [Candidatus Obscuribacterales bacterium]|nr:zinc ribbon domain-containing protein [Candidatus Obscuribacterales bacterium]
MYTCFHCSAENRETARFCRLCGKKRLVVVEDTRAEHGHNCSACQQKVRASDNYCLYCGHQLAATAVAHSKVCLFCQCELPEKAAFCAKCGQKTSGSSYEKAHIAAGLFHDDNPELMPRYEA